MNRFLTLAVLAPLAMICFFPGLSKADTVVFDSSNGTTTVVTDTTTDTTYDISVIMTTYGALPTQPWTGSAALADAFASAVGTTLGPAPPTVPTAVLGPFFAYQDESGTVLSYEIEVGELAVIGVVSTGSEPDTAIYSFASATPVTTPENGTLSLLFSGLLGLGLLVGVKRYRENRLATAE